MRRAALAAFGLLCWAITAVVAFGQPQQPGPGSGAPAAAEPGRAPTAQELAAWDIAVGPDGKELPPGRGTAVEGRAIYMQRCLACHGPTGQEGPFDRLAGGQGSLATDRPIKTVGSYWPYATTLFDYIRRAMPFDRPNSLTDAEVYAVTAYVLFLNGLVREDEVIDAHSLPQVRMPNRDGFVRDPRPDVPYWLLR